MFCGLVVIYNTYVTKATVSAIYVVLDSLQVYNVFVVSVYGIHCFSFIYKKI